MIQQITDESDAVRWLLEDNNISVKYRTLTELLEIPLTDVEIIRYKEQIYESKPVVNIFSKLKADGAMSTGAENIGEGFCFTHLAELGVDCEYPPMAKFAERLIAKHKNYDFGTYPCGDALLLRAFIMTGYGCNTEVRKFLDSAFSNCRWDGGVLCKRPVFGEQTKSCIHGSQNMLLLYSSVPEQKNMPGYNGITEYFLDRHVYFKRTDLNQTVRGDLRTVFPFNLRQGLLEPLYALSKMGFGRRQELECAWSLLDAKQTADGKYILDWTPPKTYLKGGVKGNPSKWVTLYALLAQKMLNDITLT
jgi:hypothetical protein